MSYRLGIDIGSAFTDVLAYDEGAKDLQAWKNPSPSTPFESNRRIVTGFTTNDALEGESDQKARRPPAFRPGVRARESARCSLTGQQMIGRSL